MLLCALAQPGPPVPPPHQYPPCPPPLARLAAGPPRAGPGSHLLPTAAATQWGPCERAASGQRLPAHPRLRALLCGQEGGCPGRGAWSQTGRPHPSQALCPQPCVAPVPAPHGREGGVYPGGELHAEGPFLGCLRPPSVPGFPLLPRPQAPHSQDVGCGCESHPRPHPAAPRTRPEERALWYSSGDRDQANSAWLVSALGSSGASGLGHRVQGLRVVLLQPGGGCTELVRDPADHPGVVSRKDKVAPSGKEPFSTEVLGGLDLRGPQRGHRLLAIWARWMGKGV